MYSDLTMFKYKDGLFMVPANRLSLSLTFSLYEYVYQIEVFSRLDNTGFQFYFKQIKRKAN